MINRIKIEVRPGIHINNLKGVEKLLAYMRVGRNVYLSHIEGHKDIYIQHIGNGSIRNLMSMLSYAKRMGYVDNVPGKTGIWFLKKEGLKRLPEGIDFSTVYFITYAGCEEEFDNARAAIDEYIKSKSSCQPNVSSQTMQYDEEAVAEAVSFCKNLFEEFTWARNGHLLGPQWIEDRFLKLNSFVHKLPKNV